MMRCIVKSQDRVLLGHCGLKAGRRHFMTQFIKLSPIFVVVFFRDLRKFPGVMYQTRSAGHVSAGQATPMLKNQDLLGGKFYRQLFPNSYSRIGITGSRSGFVIVQSELGPQFFQGFGRDTTSFRRI
jgi:hypothetical protein